MDLSLSPAEVKFRDEVRAWIDEALPPHLKVKADADAHFELQDIMEWHRILHAKGWVAPFWPEKYGGPALDMSRRFLLAEELELSGAPTPLPFGLRMLGPLLMEHGTEAQRQRFLPKILSGEEVWCQGYSEPGSGSDLASLSTRAEPDGKGNWVLNGQKTWTTIGHWADWIFVLARTDPKARKQEGISFFLCNMKTPGVSPKPMQTIAGVATICDTFFDNVVVPDENRVGPLNGGWTVAKSLLGHERATVAGIPGILRSIKRVKRIAAETTSNGRPLIDDPVVKAKIARLEIRVRTLQVTSHRTLAALSAGRSPGPEASILKIRGTELAQWAHELALELMGHDALAFFNEPGVVPAHEQWQASNFLYARAKTIYAGSNEIQKNIIAKTLLELPAR
jgi:alkylation response protein AidB-like acyl-CoA dehydrogenase